MGKISQSPLTVKTGWDRLTWALERSLFQNRTVAVEANSGGILIVSEFTMKKDHLEGGGSQPSRQSNERESIDPGLDDRSQLAKALDLATRVIAICVMMVLPALGGYYLDQWLGTVILFVILGTVFGLVAGFWQLFQLVRILNSNPRNGIRKDQSS